MKKTTIKVLSSYRGNSYPNILKIETAPALQEGVVPKQKEEVYVSVPHKTQFVE